MPGRARGQLLALDEHAVGPTLLREMIECRDADYAPANHHCPRVRSHSHPLEQRTSELIIVDTRISLLLIASQPRGNANEEHSWNRGLVLPDDCGRGACRLHERKCRNSAGRE